MPFSAYDADEIRLLSAALAEGMETLRKSAPGPFTEQESSQHAQRIAQNVMRAFDLGERDPAAFRRAALEGASIVPAHR